MPVRLIPNQLVKLFKTETLNQKNKRVTQDYRQYCQVVREEQTTMFQVQLLPDQNNIIVNGDFETDISGWVSINQTWQWASGRLQGSKTNATAAQIRQTLVCDTNRVYKLTATIQFTNSTSWIKVSMINGTSTNVTSIRYDASDYGLDAFTVTQYWNSQSDAGLFVFFSLDGNTGDLVYIDDVRVERLSTTTATLEDCEGNLIENIDIFAQANDIVTYSVEWFGKAEECYRICLTGTEDTESNYLDIALSLGTEGGAAIELEQGGYLKWYG